jgi:Tfp pilus assembly protein PilX
MVHERKGEEGFALIAALMVFWILTALGMLVFSVTTQDVRASSRTVGERKAFSAAESGVHLLTQNFDPAHPSSSATPTGGAVLDANSADLNTRYSIGTPSVPTAGPAAVPIAGYSFGGGESWGRQRYLSQVTGTNEPYNSTVQINVGIGFGPVDISTIYR